MVPVCLRRAFQHFHHLHPLRTLTWPICSSHGRDLLKNYYLKSLGKKIFDQYLFLPAPQTILNTGNFQNRYNGMFHVMLVKKMFEESSA